MTTEEVSGAPWWAEFFAHHGGEGYDARRWSAQNQFGSRPAVLVIDVVRSFTGDEGQSLDEATAVFPTACGPSAWTAMPHVREVIDVAARHQWPIVYTTPLAGGARLYGGTVKGQLSELSSPTDLPGAREIPEEVRPAPDALVLPKPKASAFFNTPLLSFLIRRQIDSLVVVGATTSGCVRATVVDAHSNGYPTFVVEEAVFDRSHLSHGVSLFEMNAKYADVITTAKLAELAASPRGRSS